MASTLQYPVRTLREHATALEAALAKCLAGPKPKVVHQLRSESRRLEAQLILLHTLQGITLHKGKADRLRRELHKLRHMAGQVRDLDVHEELLDRWSKTTSRSKDALKCREEALVLRKKLADRRKRMAEQLIEHVQRREAEIARRLEALSKALQRSEDVSVTGSEMLPVAEAFYRRIGKKLPQLIQPAKQVVDDDDLHELRKAAKMVRYMAEAAPATKRAHSMARKFEAVQNSGGQWHDWLELAKKSRKQFGGKHVLTQAIESARSRHRAGFLRSLKNLH